MSGYQTRNQNMFLYYGASHCDETGVIHCHASIIWVGENGTSSISKRISQVQALEAM